MLGKITISVLFTLLWITPAFAKYPVLIVPGTNDTSANMVSSCLKATLERAGYQVHTVDFPQNGQEFIQDDVKHLKDAIDRVKSDAHTDKVNIVTNSDESKPKGCSPQRLR